MESIGLEWPYSYFWLIAGVGLYFILLFWHARCLLKASTAKNAWKLIILRGLFGLIFLILITRPFIETKETNPDAVRLVAAVDLSGSMNHRDQFGGKRRIDLVRSFLDPDRTDSWVNQTRESFGAVDRLGFSIDDISAIRSSSWFIPESGENTALGDALIELLERQDKEAPGAVVLFSDGRNNRGESPLVAGDQYRNRGIPINVIGVGEAQEQGNLSVSFSEVPSEIVAKEE
ncbi:MAG: VWA domain-containing protein, partial [Verrucomicrobia bacterium]|nr:VWA domain-containing protein [Verrucomicrobiota bacterium]